jgi:hypothetical protein
VTLAALAKAQATAFLIGALDNAATLGLGDTLEAQVLRVSTEGRASLLIGRATVDVALSPEVLKQHDLTPGATLRLRVETGGANPRLALLSIAPAVTLDEAAPQTSGPRIDLTAAKHPAVEARDVALRHLGTAPIRQDGLGPLFASLVEARQSASLPPLIRQMVGALAALRVPVEDLADAQVLREAVSRSGLFHEASAAADGVPRADLKGALSALQRLLQIWTVVTKPPGAVPTEGEPPAEASIRPPLGNPPAAQAIQHSATLAKLAASIPADGDAVALDPLFAARVQTSSRPAPAAATQLHALVAMAENLADSQTGLKVPAPQLQSGAAPPPAERHLAPPRRDSHPVPQAAAPLTGELARADATVLVQTLLDKTEAALDRLKLAQVASLPTSVEVPRADAPSPLHWHAEIPLAMGRDTPVLALEVERDDHPPAGSEEGGRIWRLRFAVDIEPLGPIHALLTLQNHQVGVSLWAERETTSRTLRGRAEDLREALAQEAFDATHIDIATGAPPQSGKASGHFLDRRT